MLWGWVVPTTLGAAALVAVAGLVSVSRWRRVGPEVRHLLWLMVLVKLMVPPGAGWRFALPAPVPASVAAVAEPTALPLPEPVATQVEPGSGAEPRVLPEPECPEVLPTVAAPAATPPPALRWSVLPIETVTAVIWAVGSVLVAGWELTRVARFGCRLRRAAVPAPAWLEAEVAAVAAEFAVRPPPARVVAGLATPMLWCVGRPHLYLPAGLVTQLDPGRWRAVIAHELAHLARRDPWVARLELVAEVVWWWHPLFWVARHQVRAEAELACDARVVRLWPEDRFPYATALVDVCARLVRPATSLPAPALGVGGSRAARSRARRLTMILDGPLPRPRRLRSGLALATLAALTLPAWGIAQQPAAEAPAAAPPVQPTAPARAGAEVPPTAVAASEPEGIEEVDAEARRRFRADPQAARISREIKDLLIQIQQLQRKANGNEEPAIRELKETIQQKLSEYEDAWEKMAPGLRAEITARPREDDNTVAVLQARRDGKLAELRKAETHRDLARSTMIRHQRHAERSLISSEVLEEVKSDHKIAEAEVDVRKAALAEAEAELQRAQGQPGVGPASAESPAQVTDPTAAILQARRAGKQAELRKAEAARDLAKVAVARNEKIRSKGKQYVTDEEMARAEGELRMAQAEVEIRQAALSEIDLQQGKNPPEPARASPSASVPTPPFQEAVAPARFVPDPESRRLEPTGFPSNLADLRDEAELAELRVQQNETNRHEAEETLAQAERERKKLRSTPAAGDLAIMADLDRVEDEIRTVTQRLLALREAAPELKLKVTQAKRRVDAELARVRREAEQAKGRLRWAEDLLRKGFISPAQCDEYRNRYDDLVTLIDPDHKPGPDVAPSPATGPDGRPIGLKSK